MSTPIPKNIKLEGLELYAPRRVRTQLTSEGEAPDSQNLPQAFASDQLHAEEESWALTPDGELLKAPETRIEDAIKATVELASSLRGQEPPLSRASLPSTANRDSPKTRARLRHLSPRGLIATLLKTSREHVPASIPRSFRNRRKIRDVVSPLPLLWR